MARIPSTASHRDISIADDDGRPRSILNSNFIHRRGKLEDMPRKTAAQLNREIAVALARPRPSHLDHPATRDGRDVTDELIRESSYGHGDHVKRVATAKPAKNVEATPTLADALARVEASADPTMGFISKPLAYSRAMGHKSRDHTNLIRLIKGGYVRVCEMNAPPPAGSVAHRESPYGTKHYVLRIGHC